MTTKSKTTKTAVSKSNPKTSRAKKPASKRSATDPSATKATSRAAKTTEARSRSGQARKSSGANRTSRSRSKTGSSDRTRTSGRQVSRSSTDRFEERRTDAARQTNSRRLRIVAGLSAVSCIAVATVALINSSFLDVDEVVVVGAAKADPAAIVGASEIIAGQPLLEIDSERSAELVERVSWVGTAEVRRSLNGRVEIAIAEREPLVALPAPTGFALIDHWGRQLEVVDQRPKGYLEVTGIVASGTAGEMAPPETVLLLRFVSASSPLVNEHVRSVGMVDGDIKAQLNSGGAVNFGNGELMGQQIQALETLLTRVDLACLIEVDLRVPSAPALKRLPSSTEANPVSPDGGTTTEGGPGEDPNQTAPDC